MSLEKILVLDDEMIIRKSLEDYLRKKRYSVKSVSTIQEAIRHLYKDDGYDLFLIDLKLPDGSGIEILEELVNVPNPPMPIMLSAYGNMESVIECMRLGARDFIVKPWDSEQLEIVLKRAENVLQLEKVNRYYNEQQTADSQLIGNSPVMQNLKGIIKRVAMTEVTVLITGENGTGKELVAAELHRNSQLASHPYIRVNCAAIPENLIESEFFGHEKGSFTNAHAKREGRFELADNGTILLDEIGEISHQVQVKLLRVLQEQEFQRVGGSKDIKVNVRVLASTNRDLYKAVEKGEFREDLYYRLNVFPIPVPPLRDRGDDILLLANTFLEKFSKRHNLNLPGFSNSAEELLLEHKWPGNVRELYHAIERAVILSQNGVAVAPECLGIPTAGNPSATISLPVAPPPPEPAEPPPVAPESPPVFSEQETNGSEVDSVGAHPVTEEPDNIRSLKDLERDQILKALRHTQGNRTVAADLLGINARTLRNKINQYKDEGVEVPSASE